MPRFSVIVPVYNLEGYLEDCLASLLGQSFEDFELLLVDDASTDRSPVIVADFSARDVRIRPVFLHENGGLGNARNTGIDRATGEYVLFVDGDDWLSPEALSSLDAAIEARACPDLVVFDYVYTYSSGEQRANKKNRRALQDAPHSVFALGDYPELLNVKPAAINKAYRRGFLSQHGLRFPDGLYEDTPFGYLAVMLAESVYVLQETLYHYRKDRPGSLIDSPGPQHFDIILQWKRVDRELRCRPRLQSWRGALAGILNRQLTRIRNDTSRIPEAHSRAFSRASTHLHRLFDSSVDETVDQETTHQRRGPDRLARPTTGKQTAETGSTR